MGVVFALLCAILWAFAVILLKRSGETIPPFSLNLYRVVVSLPFILGTLAAAGHSLWRSAPVADYLILVVSGVVGIVAADTLFHRSLNLVGAGITGIIDTFYPPATVLLAFFVLGERVGIRDVAGMALIMGAVFVSTTLAPPARSSRRDLLRGILLGLTAILLLSIGIVIAKPVLEHSPVLWVTAVRQTASAIVLVSVALLSPRRGEILGVLRPGPSWRFTFPATLLGSYLALVFWIAAMKYTLTGVAAILTQSSTLFILVLAVVFLREPVTRRKIVSAGLALAGVLLVSWR